LTSAYLDSRNKEPEYTTWKIREDGEHIQTLDYMFHTEDQLRVEAVLNMPTEEQIGKNRLPSLSYASDHFSLVADFKLILTPNYRLFVFNRFFKKPPPPPTNYLKIVTKRLQC
jgi:mRNA deadenylase 3'-5' endonuclease subunit Ccr4